jgi:hypothetical protein
MTEMKLTRNSDFPWIKILFKKIDENRKKLVSIKKYYNKKRRSLGYRNNNDFVMKSNTINNEEHIKLCMLNAKYIRAMYLYIIRNYYNIYSFQRSIKKFMNVTLNQGDFLRNQCKDKIDDDTHSKKDKKYLQLTMNTFDKFRKQYKDLHHHGYFIIYTLKHHVCNDLVRNICKFI